MDERERGGPAPFSRDPRSMPLYVPPDHELPPFCPELFTLGWKFWVATVVFAVGIALITRLA